MFTFNIHISLVTGDLPILSVFSAHREQVNSIFVAKWQLNFRYNNTNNDNMTSFIIIVMVKFLLFDYPFFEYRNCVSCVLVSFQHMKQL